MRAVNKRAHLLQLLQKRRKQRAGDAVFDAQASSPADLGTASLIAEQELTPYTAPASGILGVSSSLITVADNVSVTINGKDRALPALAADEVHSLGYLEKGSVLLLVSTLVSVLTLHHFDHRRIARPIATGTFIT